MKRIRPSGARPSSYLVSTRISPRPPRARLAEREHAEAHGLELVERLRVDQAPLDEICPRDGLVVGPLLGLGRRRDQRPRQRLVLAHPVGQGVARKAPRARLVVLPDRGGRHAREIGAHDHLDRQAAALDGAGHVRVGHVDHVVGREVLRLLEPVGRELVQHLTLERDRAQDDVERAQPVGGHEDPPAAPAVALPHLAVVVLAEAGQVDPLEGSRKLLPQHVVRHHGRSLLSPRGLTCPGPRRPRV